MKHSFILTAILFGVISCGQASTKESEPIYSGPSQGTEVSNTLSDQTQPPVLFVQWQYPSTTTGIVALDVRQKVESEIANALKAKGAGQWFAGDLGLGGANMLFEVSNKEAALKIIQEIIKKEGIDKETVIAERLYTAPGDWIHKVIFPKDYKGEFNDL